MKTQQLLTGLVLAISLVSAGCSKWNQDPLADKDAALQTGEKEPSTPIGGKPTPSDFVKIHAPDYASFKEDRADEIKITGSVPVKDYTFQLSLENMKDFPGAHFDAQSGKFSWTPARGTVANGEYSEDRVLRVVVTATRPGSPVLVGTKNVVIGISRLFNAPDVMTITADRSVMRENEMATVRVRVKDLDADPADKNTWPALQITNVIGGKNLAPFVAQYSMVSAPAGTYDAAFKIDLTDAELTKDLSAYSFGLKATSRFNQTSKEGRIDINVATSFSDPVSTWQEREVASGETVDYQFMVYDPKAETKISVKEFKDLPQGAMASCTRVNPSYMSCAFLWKTDAATPVNNYRVTAKVEVANTDSKDAVTKMHDLYMVVKIKAPVVNPPASITSGGR